MVHESIGHETNYFFDKSLKDMFKINDKPLLGMAEEGKYIF